MVRTGKVIAAEGNRLQVCFERPEMCAHCGACVGGHHIHEETVQIKGHAQVGDRVSVEMPDAKIVKVSLIAYVIPLVGLLIGLLIGQSLMQSDLWAALTGLIGLGCGLLVVRVFDRKLGARPAWQPRLLEVHPAGTEQ